MRVRPDNARQDGTHPQTSRKGRQELSSQGRLKRERRLVVIIVKIETNGCLDRGLVSEKRGE